MQTFAQVKKPLNEKQDSLKVDAHQPYTVVFKHVEASTPIWIIIVSILAGILLLAIITFVLYKMGFFKRKRNADRMNLAKNGEVRLTFFSKGGAINKLFCFNLGNGVERSNK